MIKFIILEADEGMIYTNNEAYGNKIYLGKYDKKDNWYQITLEEYKKRMEAEQSVLFE